MFLLSFSTALLAEVLLGVPSSVDPFRLFPPPGVFGAISDSGERFPNIRAFLFTDRGAVVSGASPGDNGDLEVVTLGCSVAFSAWLLGIAPSSSKERDMRPTGSDLSGAPPDLSSSLDNVSVWSEPHYTLFPGV